MRGQRPGRGERDHDDGSADRSRGDRSNAKQVDRVVAGHAKAMPQVFHNVEKVGKSALAHDPPTRKSPIRGTDVPGTNIGPAAQLTWRSGPGLVPGVSAS